MNRLVDSNEPPFLRELLVKLGWVQQRLPFGDYHFGEAGGRLVAIERKTVPDFISSMYSGRLQREVNDVIVGASFPILLLEGPWHQVDGQLLDRRVTWEQCWNELQSLQDLGVRIQLTTSREHTVKRLLELTEYYSKSSHPSVTRTVSGDYRSMALSMIPGVGSKRAEGLLAYWKTLGNISIASGWEGIMETPGVGPKLAEALHAFFWYCKHHKDTWADGFECKECQEQGPGLNNEEKDSPEGE